MENRARGNALRIFSICLGLCLWIPSAQAATLSVDAQQHVAKALQSQDNAHVRALSVQDRLAIEAVLALNEGHPEAALHVLQQDAVMQDPLLAMLEAEAHRQSAIRAVDAAGAYGKSLAAQRALLQSADLSVGVREANVRLALLADQLEGVSGFPVDLLRVDRNIYSVFLVDKARSRMFVYARNAQGALVRVADEYIVTGAKRGDKEAEGDARTPNGVYRFVQRLQGKGLALRYGPVAYPIDYPNRLDVLHGKHGSGIWMHGYAEGVDRRPPRDTKGCFSLPNSRLLAVSPYVHLGHSWVVVGANFRFDQPSVQDALRGSLQASVDAWQHDWTSLHTEAYLQHYDQHFRSGHWNLGLWRMHKRRVNASKSFIDVTLSHVTMIHDPNMWAEGEIVVMDFDQTYRSDNYQDVTHKRMYWVRHKGQQEWKILSEETL